MGDPKFSRRKYEGPSHPWQAERIASERELVRRYGLKNKKELWKAQSMVRRLRAQSKELQARVRTADKQAEVETAQLLDRCGRLGLLPVEGATLNDVLSLSLEDVLQRRFQTMVFQKGLAYTPSQARQFIVHGHMAIGDRRVTIPGYVVKRAEENSITFAPSSEIANDLHPAHPKPKDALELEKARAIAEREAAKEAEAAKEPSKRPDRKRGGAERRPRVVKPALEKKLKEDISKEPDADIPDEPDTPPEEAKETDDKE